MRPTPLSEVPRDQRVQLAAEARHAEPTVQRAEPQLTYSRTWSAPSKQLPWETVVASVLADPKWQDVVEISLVYGVERVRQVLHDMALHQDIHERLVNLLSDALDDIDEGFRKVQKPS